MEYKAKYHIRCGVSHGFGVKYPDEDERTERIDSADDAAAVQEAMAVATRFADDYLSDPETGKTTVTLQSLAGPKGDVTLDPEKPVVERTMLQHMLALYAEEHRGDSTR
jgi:hypothetical protein